VAAVFKSILVAAAFVLVGFGAGGAVWAEPVSASRVIPDPLVKHRPTYVDHSFSDAAIAARFATARARDSAGGTKGRRFWFKPAVCLVERAKPVASTTYGKGPVVLEQVSVDETNSAVPARLRRPQYPGPYITGYVPGSSGPCSGANVGQIGDFWAGMNRSTIRNGSPESQTKLSTHTVSGENAK
jgi:hypothetical protein